ncbi:hypothetical protein AWM68_03535 [Fictibacillus phosphorivorans]|uniref:Uncharacterized protein n=1 Tax=Fictibacillus phosphorivorans TaxID=1221500 RepID=A0A165P8N5_9BACL|nr:hypothetical protein AWM68_03535 [Fictibacillus phosphorivorans]
MKTPTVMYFFHSIIALMLDSKKGKMFKRKSLTDKFYVIQKEHQEVRISCEIFFRYTQKEWGSPELYWNR